MEKNNGIKRLLYATLYSWKGFQSAIVNESAFRQEFVLFIGLATFSFFLDVTGIERLAMISSVAFILIVELLNSAIEAIVDRISTEHHTLSGRAKDYGSLAVLISLLIATSTWLVILF